MGGGLELALACHMRLATFDAKLGLPELTLGIIPGFAGSVRLPLHVGKAKAAEMILTSEPITGEEAATVGLVNSVHSDEELVDAGKELARKISQKSTISTKMVLEMLQYDVPQQYEEAMRREAELAGQALIQPMLKREFKHLSKSASQSLIESLLQWLFSKRSERSNVRDTFRKALNIFRIFIFVWRRSNEYLRFNEADL